MFCHVSSGKSSWLLFKMMAANQFDQLFQCYEGSVQETFDQFSVVRTYWSARDLGEGEGGHLG